MRPVIFAGGGVRNYLTAFMAYVDRMKFPVVTTLAAYDILPYDHPQNMGRYGGNPSAKLTVEAADTIIVLGSELSFVEVGYEEFAPHAEKFTQFLVCIQDGEWPKIWSAIKQEDEELALNPEFVNSYLFARELSEIAEDVTVVTGNATDAFSVFRFWKVKEGQRLIANEKFGAMGWDLPAAIGAHIASKKQTLLVTGDGSFQLNIQELLTISHNHFDIKMFILNNFGYASIRRTQDTYCEGRRFACTFYSPYYRKLCEAYALTYYRLSNNEDISSMCRDILATPYPVLCEVMVDPNQVKL